LSKESKERFFVVVVQNDSSPENDLLLVVGKQPQQHFEQWVLNSGSFYHMCPHKSWFATYEEKSSCNVLMGKMLLAS